MNTATVAIIVAIIAIVPGAYGAISARKRTSLADRFGGIFGDAYERARKVDQEIVAGLREEIERLRGELQEVRQQASDSARANKELERKYAAMERRLERMLSLINQLRMQGVEIPDIPEMTP